MGSPLLIWFCRAQESLPKLGLGWFRGWPDAFDADTEIVLCYIRHRKTVLWIREILVARKGMGVRGCAEAIYGKAVVLMYRASI